MEKVKVPWGFYQFSQRRIIRTVFGGAESLALIMFLEVS